VIYAQIRCSIVLVTTMPFDTGMHRTRTTVNQLHAPFPGSLLSRAAGWMTHSGLPVTWTLWPERVMRFTLIGYRR